MTKHIRHIAWVLWVVFAFPVTYQPLHIVWHHGHGESAVCCHEAHVCHIGYRENQSGERLAEKEDQCPVCDFRFSVNSVPVHTVVESYVPTVKIARNETVVEKFVPCIVLIKSPRAPPSLA